MEFSIVIPVYNVADYLDGCIQSVLQNDLRDTEVILVDDGSTDGLCPGICDRYAQAHPGVIQVVHQENQGLGGARNTGLELARGQYLLFVDSDDTLVPHALDTLRRAIQDFPADLYSFPLYAHDGSGHGRVIPSSKVYPEPFTLAQHPEFLTGLPATWARAWRRRLFTDSGIRFPSRVYYEDIRTSPKLFALAQTIVTLDTPLYRYLARPGSIMRQSGIQRNREILWAFEDVLEWFASQGLLEQYRGELCRLAVDHVLLAATVRVARADPTSGLLRELTAFVREKFPEYGKNPYLRELPPMHRLLLALIRLGRFRLVRWLFLLKDGPEK